MIPTTITSSCHIFVPVRNLEVAAAIHQVLRPKRLLVETVFDEFKKRCQIEHNQYCFSSNFVVKLIGVTLAYCRQPVKPRIALPDSRYMLAVN